MTSDPEKNISYLLRVCSGRLDVTHEQYAYPTYDMWSEWNIRVGDEPYQRTTVRRVPVVALKMPEDKLEIVAECVANYNQMEQRIREIKYDIDRMKRKEGDEWNLRKTYPAIQEAYDKYMAELEKHQILEILKK